MSVARTPPPSLARSIMQWATEEMGFDEQALPSLQEMEMMVSRGSSAMWQHIVGHVRSQGTAEIVRGNVLLNTPSIAGTAGHAQVATEELDRLSQEHNALACALGQLQQEEDLQRANVAQAEEHNSILREECVELIQKAAWLSVFCSKCRELMRLLRELSKRLRHKLEVSRCWEREKQAHYRAKPRAGERKGGGALDSPSTVVVREACSLVKTLVALLDGFGISGRQVESARQRAWRGIEGLAASSLPSAIVEELVRQARKGRGEVRRYTAAIDLQRDAKHLQYEYREVDGTVGADTSESIVQSIANHLLEAQLSHIKSGTERERVRQSTAALHQRLLGLQRQLTRQLGSSTRHWHSAHREAERRRVGLEVEGAGLRETLRTLKGLCAALELDATERRSTLAALRAKQRQMKQFSHLTKLKQVTIQKLIKHNSAAKLSLQTQQTELVLYFRQCVCGCDGGRVELGAERGGVWSEAQSFSQLVMGRTLKIEHTVPLCELSINRLRPALPNGSPPLSPLLRLLGIPPHLSPEAVLCCVLKLVQEGEAWGEEVDRNRKRLRVREQGSAVVVHARAALGLCVAHRRMLMEQRLPEAQQIMGHASQALAGLPQVQEGLRTWWDQPAQHLAPWITYEGMDVARWLEQWRVLSAKLNQLRGF